MQINSGTSLSRRGENFVSNYLSSKGFRIITNNYRIKGAEIDIIALKDSTLCFIEVKTRKSLQRGKGVFAVNEKKMRKIVLGAKFFLRSNPQMKNFKIRIDVADVYFDTNSKPELNYYENVWQEY